MPGIAHGLIIDSFAGGGGASTGIAMALGRSPDIAINHSPEAIAVHAANHPDTKHYREDIFTVDPVEACGGRHVSLAWFSPDCTHFSRAKGSKPRSSKVRCLANVVLDWARKVRPAVIMLENVEEFQDWGPLDDFGQPIKARAGEDYQAWRAELNACGYAVESELLVASDYGAPTSRRRFFLVARCDGLPIVWPTPTHGFGRSSPRRKASEIIDWTLPCPSIFQRKKPLAESTMRRVAEGIRRFVTEAKSPFIVPSGPMAAGCVIKHYNGVVGHDARRPLGTVTTVDHHSLAVAFLSKFYGTSTGSDVRNPMPTVTAAGQHLAEVRAFMVKYYGTGTGQQIDMPLGTVTTRDRFGLVMVRGEPHQIVDIGLRMLQPRELFSAQGFPPDYVIDATVDGRPLSKTAQVRLAGNSVCPQVARALVEANIRLRAEVAA